MDVILLEKIGRLGNLGDQVSVKVGYGRNFLIPSGKAVPATKDNIAAFQARRAELEKLAQEKLDTAQKRAAALQDLKVSICANAGDEGKLFGSVGTQEVAKAITQASGIAVEKSEIRMPNGAFREIGEYEVTIQLHTDVKQGVTVIVVAQ
jgi:large subunit ribosomal protein L9